MMPVSCPMSNAQLINHINLIWQYGNNNVYAWHHAIRTWEAAPVGSTGKVTETHSCLAPPQRRSPFWGQSPQAAPDGPYGNSRGTLAGEPVHLRPECQLLLCIHMYIYIYIHKYIHIYIYIYIYILLSSSRKPSGRVFVWFPSSTSSNVVLWFPSLLFLLMVSIVARNIVYGFRRWFVCGFRRGRKTFCYGFRRWILGGFCRRRRIHNF